LKGCLVIFIFQVFNTKKIIKLSNSLDIKTLKDLKQGLDDLIKLIEQFRD